MTSSLKSEVVKNIVKRVINGQDYRVEIVNLINAEFLQYSINFFKKVVEAKLQNKDITIDWYKKEFLSETLPTEEIIIHSGLNKKTIHNMYNSSTRTVCIEASNEHYESLYHLINTLVNEEKDLNINLTIKFRNVSVELNLSESLIVINALAVKRAAFRGGLWSTAGKKVEKVLMKTLCALYNVPEIHYSQDNNPQSFREVDFFLINKSDSSHRCEVKLMGKGNPESADAVIARETQVFVADKLSDKNKEQLNSLNIRWVELRNKNTGYRKFKEVLKELNIPYEDFSGDLEAKLDFVLDKIVEKDKDLIEAE